METAEALARQDVASKEHVRSGRKRLVSSREPFTGPGPGRELRPAGGTGRRLSVKAAIERILVLGSAGRAERKARHRRVLPVVGEIADDREARTAVRAVREGIAEAAVRRVEDLREAVGARPDVGQDEDRFDSSRAARFDAKRLFSGGWEPRLENLVNPCPRRRRFAQPRPERGDPVRLSLHLQEESASVVAHPAAEAEARRDAVHVRPESHALYGPAHLESQPLTHDVTEFNLERSRKMIHLNDCVVSLANLIVTLKYLG